MRILVTGACGFVGPYLVKALVESGGHEVIASVHSHHLGETANCCGEPLTNFASQIVELDVTDSMACGELIGEFRPECVYHLAGLAFAPDAAAHFDKALSVNVHGPFNICQALADHCPQSRMIFASSGEVYGAIAEDELPICEEQVARPMNPYSLTKLQAEAAVEFFARRAGIPALIARPFNHFGPGQSEKFVTAAFASQLARIALGKQPAQLLVGNLDAKRDFTDVRDIVDGYVALLDAKEGCYNLCAGQAPSIQEILDILVEESGVSVEIQQDPTRMRPAEVPEVRGSFEKIHKACGWAPKRELRASLRELYEYWLKKERELKG
jgi:GDP-4-dehydro-6-deoxy-D-mannose reductase